MKGYLLIIILFLSSILLAEENTEDKETWKGDVQFGYVSSTGNTESSNFSGKVNIEKDYTQWKHAFKVVALSTTEDKETTGRRFILEYQADRKYNDSRYLFINSSYDDDRFSGYDYRASITGGYGLQLYDNNNMKLDTEIGLGYRQSELTFDPVFEGETSESEAIVRAAVKYLWQIEKNRSVNSELIVEAGDIATITNFELGFVTMIVGDLSFKASFTSRHTDVVPDDKEKLDTITSMSLLYAF